MLENYDIYNNYKPIRQQLCGNRVSAMDPSPVFKIFGLNNDEHYQLSLRFDNVLDFYKPPNSNFDPSREFNDRLFKERNSIIYHPKGIRTGREWAKSKVRFHIRVTSNPRILDSLTSLLNAKTVYCTTLLINQMRKDNFGVIQNVFSTEFCFQCLQFQTQFEKVPSLVLDEITLESDSGDNESGEGTSSSG
ncbi:hypothetical protein B9Z55_025378 [Caenorhabditis nigoni]|nr:hypothetical protein B9Z55_025378 [Caenorhabditis nigoni]